MATVRYLVNDVDAAIAFYSALGFVLADRWGPPFAVMKLGDLTLWVSGPGTSPRATGALRRPLGQSHRAFRGEEVIRNAARTRFDRAPMQRAYKGAEP